MKVAIVTTDSRENYRDYRNEQPSFGAAPEALLQGFAEVPELEVHVISCLQEPVSAPEKLASNIWYHALHVPKIGWLRTGYQGCIRAIRKLLHALRPDIVHGQGTERDCGIAAVMSGFPNVVTIHGNMAELARLYKARPVSYPWCAARLEDFTLRRTDGVFCNSEYTERLVRPRARRTWKVANAIRKEFFEAPQTVAPSRPGVMLNVGVISPRKQQVELLDFARSIHREHPSLRLAFIGAAHPDDPYAREFFGRIKDRGQYPFAEYLGTMGTAQLIRTFDEASALLHFPIEEAFGLVVVEALSRGLKLFASHVGGIVDIATPVQSASLFASTDWKGLAKSIGQWSAGGHPRSNEAIPLVEKLYHPRVIAQRHLDIYQEILSV